MPKHALILLSTAALLGAQSAPPTADAVLAAARTALGGEARLAAIKTLTVTGRTRQVRGENLVPIEFEIAIELPNKYLRKDEVPAQESGPTTVGFNGDELIQEPVNAGPPQGRPGGPPPPTPEQLQTQRRARVVGVKQDFARLMLGLLASSFESYPLTFSYVGQAEAPQGMADVLEGKGAPNLTLRYFVYRDTHLPVLITWQGAAAGPGRGGPGPARGPAPGASGPPAAGGGPLPGAATAPGAAPPPGALAGPAGTQAQGPPAAPPENRIYFADYRDVDGVKFPFRLRRAVGQDTVEETTFDRFRVNAKIDPKRFDTKK